MTPVTELATKPYLSVEAGARYLDLDEEHLRNLLRQGKLPALKCGRLWRIPRAALDALVTTAPPSQRISA